MATVKELISRGGIHIFRRISMKRLQLDGTYESDWYDITWYVNTFPTIEKGFGDEILLGEYEIEGFDIELDNSQRKFNRENEPQSLFHNFASRRMVKFKIELGLLDDDGDEVEGLVFFGILYGDPTTSDNGIISIPVSGLLKVFQLFPASGIAVTATDTETMIQRIYDKQVNSVSVFSKFFEGSSINPGSASVSSISTPLIEDNQTCWDKITQYSIYDDFFAYIDSAGKFVWDDRSESASEQWKFNGAGAIDKNDYGINIISVESEQDGTRNFFPRITIEYEDDTFATSETSWTPGDLSTVDIYGERTYSQTYKELDSTEASTMALKLKNTYNNIKKEWVITTVFIPLELKSKIEVNYLGQYSEEGNPFILGVSEFGDGSALGDYMNSINLDEIDTKVIRVSYDLENITATYQLREV
jgi:hypothetical protein